MVVDMTLAPADVNAAISNWLTTQSQPLNPSIAPVLDPDGSMTVRSATTNTNETLQATILAPAVIVAINAWVPSP